jgi:predicted nicotinamide N-methyase
VYIDTNRFSPYTVLDIVSFQPRILCNMEDWKRPINKYPVMLDSTGSTLEIDIHVPTLRAENLHFQTWGSARVLANQLHTIPVHPEAFTDSSASLASKPNILELGAGTGLAGLAAAALWRTSLVLTDLAPFVPGLARNIDVNRNLLEARGASAESGALDWEEPAELPVYSGEDGAEAKMGKVYRSERDKAGVIVVADCLYSEDHPRMLVGAIVAWLRRGKHSRVVVCYPLRVAYLDIIRELWELMEERGLESVGEGKEEILDEVWDDERLHEWGVWKWREESI